MESGRRLEAAADRDLLDTIAAIATPPGVGALAVIRVSGPGAFDVVSRLTDVPRDPPRTAHVRTLRSADGEVLDQAVVTLFPGPASYTGEDMVEISTHGGRIAPHLVQNALERAGARRARPGEFTQRAWLNGKVDLVQAEAVADLVEGSSRALHRVALRQLDRGLSKRIASLRSAIVELEARMVHHIDFPEEDDAPVGLGELADEARRLASGFERLAATAPAGRLLRQGVRTVLAGRPNAGKSSLLNALVGESRAIVTDVAGTTRDRIEVSVEIDGLPFVLVDTAGLRATDDVVEREGVAMAEAAIEGADLVLYCVPVGEASLTSEAEWVRERVTAPVIGLLTKGDHAEAGGVGDSVERGDAWPWVVTSALEGTGLDVLRDAMVRTVFSGAAVLEEGASVLTRDRQVEGVRMAAREMQDFARALESGIPPEVAAAHLKAAATATEELLGTIGAEEVLDRVFSDFCIGK
ncbi:MAG TPA: tRNA uridine-5-carboxymethylaminomethyl(34) synthesis GTPase MnmE [Longimicrobiales bacterium]|nr:tRNA uridine-5-carboxymethylaminomethyl(34) synthesis GTPase MnmE [Longimicrobiales bacterium]